MKNIEISPAYHEEASLCDSMGEIDSRIMSLGGDLRGGNCKPFLFWLHQIGQPYLKKGIIVFNRTNQATLAE